MKNTIVSTEKQMLNLAGKYAKKLHQGDVIFLHGELGAGKTTFVRGILRFLGYKKSVKSPTYTLVEDYRFDNFNIYHFDLYRLSNPEELESIGIRDYFNDQSICFLEWPEKGEGFLPTKTSKIYIEYLPEGRYVKFLDCFSLLKSRLENTQI